MHKRRGITALAPLGLSCALLGLVPLPAAHAGCAGPIIGVGETVDEARLPDSGVLPAPGAEVTVAGLAFGDGCDDTGPDVNQGSGCSAPTSTSPSEEKPMRDVDLVLEQGDASWVLDTQDATSREDGYSITWTAPVPPDAQPGPATLRAGFSELAVEIAS